MTLTPTSTDPTTEVNQIIQDVEVVSTAVASAATTVATANWWTALCGLLTALPGIVSLAKSFFNWMAVIGGDTPQQFIAQLGNAFDQLAAAKTLEDKQNAAQSIAKAIGNIK
jgi:hypothetical protein